jgi:Xaa-Pro aminopeptidase
MRERIEKLRARMQELNVPAALIRHPVNIGYLSGFSGSTAALLITESAQRFITDSRYRAQSGEECPGFAVDVTETGGTYEARIAASARELGVQKATS